MRTPEDEAFDEIERRQGGFQAKRAMAAAKLDNDDLTIAYMSGYHDGKRAAQPAQEPVDWEQIYWDMVNAMLRDKLRAQPAQEPAFGWIKQSELAQARLYGGSVNLWLEKHDCDFPVYVAPPQRTWVGLTDEERDDLLDTYITAEGRARAIEAKLKEKNT